MAILLLCPHIAEGVRSLLKTLIPVTSWRPSFWKLTLEVRISPYVRQSDRVHSKWSGQDWHFCGHVYLRQGDCVETTQPTHCAHSQADCPRSLWPFAFSMSLRVGTQSVQSLSCVWLFATPWTAACQASLPPASPTPRACSDLWVGTR